ncbi:MAG TPA: hypothetical protein VGN68_15155 [Sphingopyxis sp.]|jgi:hypothetical protein|uniref:hypothetical protein n=1 Tax=Sphingopyxis sp. TaxID=1908224 RepID=UPI002E15438B|nr:hypothetical protein [Sphingopyxis sp.]
MKDELWMRTWNNGHPHFSNDLHRGLLWLLASFRRVGSRVARPVPIAGAKPLPVTQHDAA